MFDADIEMVAMFNCHKHVWKIEMAKVFMEGFLFSMLIVLEGRGKANGLNEAWKAVRKALMLLHTLQAY
jgi:hypothetical protein